MILLSYISNDSLALILAIFQLFNAPFAGRIHLLASMAVSPRPGSPFKMKMLQPVPPFTFHVLLGVPAVNQADLTDLTDFGRKGK